MSVNPRTKTAFNGSHVRSFRDACLDFARHRGVSSRLFFSEHSRARVSSFPDALDLRRFHRSSRLFANLTTRYLVVRRSPLGAIIIMHDCHCFARMIVSGSSPRDFAISSLSFMSLFTSCPFRTNRLISSSNGLTVSELTILSEKHTIFSSSVLGT